jgi:hypothetical protein
MHMPYFIDDIISRISIACNLCQNDGRKARDIVMDIKNKEDPLDPEVKYIIEKMIFLALDSPKKFRQLGIDLIYLLSKNTRNNKNDKR